jgi:hypothetical protein
MSFREWISILCVSAVLAGGVSGAHSQELRDRPIRLHYENTDGEKGLSTFDYNNDGTVNVGVWELLDGTRSSVNFYSYSGGNLVKVYREFSDSITSTLVYGYDGDGNLVSEHFERSDSVVGDVEYRYDESGRLVAADCDGLKGWFFGAITYRYDADGRKVGGDVLTKRGNAGTIEYSYDDKGRLAGEVWDFPGLWGQTFVYEYDKEYGAPPAYYSSSNAFITGSGYRVIKEDYNYADETGGPSLYEYNADGKLVKKTFIRSDSLTTETRYLYDGGGFLVKSYRQMSDGRAVIFDYEYDAGGRMTGKTFRRSDLAAGSESYEYGDRGWLSRAHYDNVDFWLTGDISFSCDEQGRPAAGSFKGEDGFDAGLSFSYDGNGNLEKIDWEFSFGKFQTYHFQYEPVSR